MARFGLTRWEKLHRCSGLRRIRRNEWRPRRHWRRKCSIWGIWFLILELMLTRYVLYLETVLSCKRKWVDAVGQANINEPDWQQTFWGTNYPKLASIKNKYDPTDVFWCHPCVGNEGWKEVGNQLCRVWIPCMKAPKCDVSELNTQ